MDSIVENKIKHKSKLDVAVTVDGKRYVSTDGVLNVSYKVSKCILNDYPDWGKANPKPKKVKDDGK